MPDDRDFICFGVEKTLDEKAWEAELDLMGGYQGMVRLVLEERLATIVNTKPTSYQVYDLLLCVASHWKSTGSLRPGYPGQVVDARVSYDAGRLLKDIYVEVDIFECFRPSTVTVRAYVQWFSTTCQWGVATRVEGKAYTEHEHL